MTNVRNVSMHAAAVLLLCVSCCVAQDIHVDTNSFSHDGQSGYRVQWDSVFDRVIFYRNITAYTAPALLLVDSSGHLQPVYPLRDLPGATQVTIWGTAATPDGGAIASAVVEYSKKLRRSLLLTYDATGRLRKLWDMYPAEPHFLAVDRQGDIFGLGYRNVQGNYPLLVKYSPDGEILGEFLPANMFPEGDQVVQIIPGTSVPAMFISNGELVIWLAHRKEIMRLSLDGHVLGRFVVADTLRSVTSYANGTQTRIYTAAASGAGRLLFDFVVFSGTAPNVKAQFGTLSVGRDGSSPMLTGPLSATKRGRMIGTTSDGRPVFLMPGETNSKVIVVR